MADKQDVHKILHDINSQEDALNCSLTGKSSGSGSSINPVALYLQAGKLPHQTFDTQQLVAAEKSPSKSSSVHFAVMNIP